MKKLELNQMENLQGGDTLDGICAIIGMADAGLALRFLIKRVISVTPLGATILAAGTLVCLGRTLDLY